MRVQVLCVVAWAVAVGLGVIAQPDVPAPPTTLGTAPRRGGRGAQPPPKPAGPPPEPGQVGGGAVDTTASPLSPEDNACSHELSRKVRAIVKDHVLTAAAAEGFELPVGCPLHPALDRYRAIESEHREKARGSHWKCKLCGKLFKSAQYLDAHFDRAHPDTIPAAATTCLADYCDIFGCDLTTPAHLKSRPSALGGGVVNPSTAVTAQAATAAAALDAASLSGLTATPQAKAQLRATQAAARNHAAQTSRYAAQISSEHHHTRTCVPRNMEVLAGVCKQLFHKCFPPDAGGSALRLHDRFLADVCGALRCVDGASGAELPARGAAMGLASAAPADVAAASAPASGAMGGGGGGGAASRRAVSFAERMAVPAAEDARRPLYWVGVGFLALVLAMFYAGLYLYRSDLTFHNDLRRLKSSRHASRLAFWRREKEKDKPF